MHDVHLVAHALVRQGDLLGFVSMVNASIRAGIVDTFDMHRLDWEPPSQLLRFLPGLLRAGYIFYNHVTHYVSTCEPFECRKHVARSFGDKTLLQVVRQDRRVLFHLPNVQNTDSPWHRCFELLKRRGTSRAQALASVESAMEHSGYDDLRRALRGGLLHLAAREGFVEVLVLVLSRNDILWKDICYEHHVCYSPIALQTNFIPASPLAYAVEFGRAEAVIFLLHAACIFEGTRYYLMNAEARSAFSKAWFLQVACYRSYVLTAKVLLAAGARVEHECGVNHWTCLLLACWVGCVALVRLLLEHGANIEAVTPSGDKALHVACRTKRGTPVVIFLLKTPGLAWVHENNLQGEKSIDIACKHGFMDTVVVLLAQGAGVCYSSSKCSPLEHACFGGHLAIVQLLADRLANCECSWPMLGRGLVNAAERGHCSVVSKLLEENLGPRGARAQVVHGALLAACKTARRIDMLRLLLDQGTITSKHLEHLLSLACRSFKMRFAIRAADELLKRGVVGVDNLDSETGLAPLHFAAQKSKALTRLLLDWGANADVFGCLWVTPLLLACRCGSVDVVEILLQRGANVDIPIMHFPWATPLAFARVYGFKPIALLLYQHGARVDGCILGEDVLPVLRYILRRITGFNPFPASSWMTAHAIRFLVPYLIHRHVLGPNKGGRNLDFAVRLICDYVGYDLICCQRDARRGSVIFGHTFPPIPPRLPEPPFELYIQQPRVVREV